MLCDKPYMKIPTGIKPAHLCNEEARLAATPFACGQCLHCRMNQARVDKTRIMLEASQWERNCWTTLTYDDVHLPRKLSIEELSEGFKYHITGRLRKDHLQKFIKRVRKRFYPLPIRFYAVGEYGDQSWRPHYHVILFNIGLEESYDIKKCWTDENKQPIGHTKEGDINPHSAGYVAGYTTSKVTKRNTIDGRIPEFKTSSTGGKFVKGGIGYNAVVKIANTLKSCPDMDKENFTEIAIGKKKYPIGRYLANTIHDIVHDDCSINDPKSDSLNRYQADQIIKAMEKEDVYYDSILEETRAKRWAREKRAKIFETTRTI